MRNRELEREGKRAFWANNPDLLRERRQANIALAISFLALILVSFVFLA